MILRRVISRAVVAVLAAAVAAVYLVPLWLVLLNSVKSAREAAVPSFDLPATPLFSNYAEVLSSPDVLRGMLNGLVVAGSVTVLTVLVCALAAFVIARRPNRVTGLAYSYLVVGLVAPFAFIPAIRLLQLLGLYGTLPGLILVDVGMQVPFITLIFVGFVRQVPREIDEAARLDGCTTLGVFFRVVFPLMRPATLTAVILVATFAWNEFRNVLFLVPDSSRWTVPMTVYNFQGLHTFNYALVCAHLVVTMAPIFVVYLFTQRYILAGMAAGAIR